VRSFRAEKDLLATELDGARDPPRLLGAIAPRRRCDLAESSPRRRRVVAESS